MEEEVIVFKPSIWATGKLWVSERLQLFPSFFVYEKKNERLTMTYDQVKSITLKRSGLFTTVIIEGGGGEHIVLEGLWFWQANQLRALLEEHLK